MLWPAGETSTSGSPLYPDTEALAQILAMPVGGGGCFLDGIVSPQDLYLCIYLMGIHSPQDVPVWEFHGRPHLFQNESPRTGKGLPHGPAPQVGEEGSVRSFAFSSFMVDLALDVRCLGVTTQCRHLAVMWPIQGSVLLKRSSAFTWSPVTISLVGNCI